MAYPIVEYRGSDGDDHLWIKYLDGTQIAADPYLLAKFGGDADRPWKSTMIGRGCQIVIVTALYNSEYFSSVPAGVFEPHPLRLYDLRKDSTNGGSGSHRWSDPSTWETSNNNPVMIYNIIRGMYYGDQWMFGGQNLAAHRLPASNWIAGANEADRQIDLAAGGTESQFRGGFEIAGDKEPLDIIDYLRDGCSARIAEAGGIFKILVGGFAAAVYSFSDEDILVTEGQTFDPFPGLDATFNAIEATYPEPDEKWAMKDAPGLYNADLEVLDGNRRLPAGVQFPSTPFATQVQRLMRAMILENRRFRTHQFYLPPEAWLLESNDIVSWTSNRNGYDEKKFIVLTRNGGMNMNQLVTLKEVDPSDYDWHSGLQLPTTISATGGISTPAQPMEGWTVEPYTIRDASGISRRPAIKVGCAANLTDVSGVWVTVRNTVSGDIVFDSNSTPYAEPYSWILSGDWCLPATAYQVRGELIAGTNRPTLPSNWIDVTTDNIRFGIDDIDVDALGDAIKDFFDVDQSWVIASVRSIILEQQRVARLIIDQDFSKTTDKQQLLTQLTSTTGLITAAYTDAVVAATGPSSAIVQRLTTVEATIPGLATATVVDALTSRVSTTETGFTALAGRTTAVETALPGKASVDSLTSLANTVTSQGNAITAQGQQITSINAALPDKASVSSVSSLAGTVSQQGDTITSQGQQITSIGNALSGKASADAVSSLSGTVQSQGNAITAQGQQITSISNTLSGKASTDSVSSLSGTVTQQGNAITANAQAITSVNATVGKFSAQGMFRTTVEATPTGAQSKIGLGVATSSETGTSEAAIYLTAMANGKAIASILADQFVILNPDGSGGYFQPFAVENGTLYVANAVITQAQIADLMVGKSNIPKGAVSRIDYAASGAAAIGTSNTPITGIESDHGADDLISILVTSCFSIAGNAGTISVIISIWDSYNNTYTATIPLTFNTSYHFSHSFNFTPAAGQASTTFRFDVRVVSGTNVQANNRTIRAETVYR